MARVQVSVDADVVIDVMLLSGVSNAQDAVEVVLRDYLARGTRTETVTGQAPDSRERTATQTPPPETAG